MASTEQLLQFFKQKQVNITSSIVFVASVTVILVASVYAGIAMLVSYFGGILLFHLLIQPNESVPNVLFMLKRRKRIVSRSEVPRSCTICGDNRCKRHKADFNVYNLQPWSEIKIPQQVDEALEDLLNSALEKYVYSWYSQISDDDNFVHELRVCLRFMLSVLIRRSMKIDLTNLILDRVMKVSLQHLDCCLQAQRISCGGECEENILKYYGSNIHVAMRNRQNEVNYLRHLSRNILQYILPKKYLKCKNICTLIPELLSNSLLLPTMDFIANPATINRLMVVFFDKNEMVKYDESISPSVDLLSNFVESRTPTRSSTLQIPLSRILSNQKLLYPFMQFMIDEAAVNVLQFCLAVEDFNRKILNPELTNHQLVELHQEAQQIYKTYCAPNALDKVQLDVVQVEHIRKIVYGPAEDIIQLRMSPPLFKCYDQAFSLLEKTFWPLFHQSDACFTLLCGSRLNEKNERGAGRSPKKELSTVAKIGTKLNKIKDVFKSNTIDGKLSDDAIESGEIINESNGDVAGNPLEPKDLSAWRVSIPKIDTILEGGYKLTYVYVIEIQNIDFKKSNDPSEQHWRVERRYHEFYILEAKLMEFHGDLDDYQLPAKRSSAGKGFDFMESRRPVFEDYLQKLLSTPHLKSSELLYRFLKPGPEFTVNLFPDINLGRMIKTMPMKLLKEKGQHLESFLLSLIQSTIASPSKSRLNECKPSEQEEKTFTLKDRIENTIYKNNANLSKESRLPETGRLRLEMHLDRLYDYLIYAAIRIFDVVPWLLRFILSIRNTVENSFETYITWFVDCKLDFALAPPRCAYFIRLLRDAVIADDDSETSEMDENECRELALNLFRESFFSLIVRLIGTEKFHEGTGLVFSYLQYPRLNKQISYTLLDIVVTELFPELSWPTRASFSEK